MPQEIPTYQITDANLVFIVKMLDEILHTTEHPFCLDLEGCPCHEDSNLVREYITKPLDAGLLTNAEAMRLYFGTQLVSAQDAAITDEEMEQVMSEPSPLEVDIEENYHRPLRISAQFQGMMDSLLIEHD